MSEQEQEISTEVEQPAWKIRQAKLRGADTEHLGYDFLKTVMNVSLLSLGAVLTLGETAYADLIPDWGLFASIGLIALAGISSFIALQEMVRLFNGVIEQSQTLRFLEPIAPTLFGGGISLFVGLAIGIFG
ncbi:hypothetical protein [Sphingomicrobium sediminis]|uniref:Uncharacterized protein n=1 Tax=Sphingomicrobium sediminis TaxID=2950949 RepID=A0A9X2EJ57_9SPHN|nr:hypothetical protein [Sphingomicrobium sediminis]MCM8558441.1 hypothetical protein [Sphingomicrobium sediminis]